jgi:hypothetical protein
VKVSESDVVEMKTDDEKVEIVAEVKEVKVLFLVVSFLLHYRVWILYFLLPLIFFCTYAFLAGLYGSV